MPDLRQFAPFPATVTGRARASWGGRWRRLSPLARNIAIILVVKAVVLCLIWYAFFRAPAAPRMAMDPQRVEQQFLAPAPHPEPPHAVR